MRRMYLSVTVEEARKKGIDWNARRMWFSNSTETVRLLERLVAELKGERDE